MRNKHAKVSDPNSFVSYPGDRDRITYVAKVAENGLIEVVPNGKEDFQAYIESFKSQTDMAYIMKQLSLGNVDVLHQSAAQYGDFTMMPTTLAEAMQIEIDAERKFYELPLDTRSKFNNNFREWLFSAGTSDWLDKMGLNNESFEKGENPAPVAEE